MRRIVLWLLVANYFCWNAKSRGLRGIPEGIQEEPKPAAIQNASSTVVEAEYIKQCIPGWPYD